MIRSTTPIDKKDSKTAGADVPSSNGPGVEQHWNHYVQFRDPKTKEILLMKYSYLVRYVLGRMKVSLVPYLDHDDLESAGIISLIQALDRFDPARGIKFETYAYRRIQGGILDYLRQIDFLSRSSRERIKKFKRSFERLTESLGRTPSDDEIMEDLRIDANALKQIYFELSCECPLSLDSDENSPDGRGNSKNHDGGADVNEPEILDQLLNKEMATQLAQAIDCLPERERNLISLYYYEDLTFKEIGVLFKVSESRICQMHTKVLLEIETKLNKRDQT